MGEEKTTDIPVKYYLRMGEHSQAGHFEFPHIDFIYAILESTPVKEQKRYNLHLFDNILVANRDAGNVMDFLREGGRKAGFEIEFVEVEVSDGSKTVDDG